MKIKPSVQDLKTYPRTGGKFTPETTKKEMSQCLALLPKVVATGISARPCGKRVEPGNLRNQDIKAEKS
ncbi:MAG: hypothetical protein HC773_13415 [Scytonema sp. CRU_2_7]|nr:hypothetical protein [Scytonema sp. CRU_2_7]